MNDRTTDPTTDPIVVTALFYPLAGQRHAVLAAITIAIAAVHTEPGCLLYAIHEAPDGTLVMIEKWQNEALLDAHGDSPAVATLVAALGGLLAQPVAVTRMVPIPAGTVAQGKL